MVSILLFFVFLFGLAIGSFLNVLIYRLPHDLPILGRSFCPRCKKKIAWQDNIPLLSFAILGGKCRHCRFPISLQYPVVELTTAVLFVLTAFYITQTRIMNYESGIMDFVTLGYNLFIVSALIAIFFTDLKSGIIPNKIIYPSVLLSTVYLLIIHNSLFIIHLLSAFGAFAFFLLLFLVTRGRGMGFGDLKLAFLMGLFLGFPKIVIALYIAFLTGAVVSLILVLWGKKKFFGGTIPFGPFLVLGTLVSLFFGEGLLRLFLLLL